MQYRLHSVMMLIRADVISHMMKLNRRYLSVTCIDRLHVKDLYASHKLYRWKEEGNEGRKK